MLEPYQKRIDVILQRYEKPYWDPLSQFARLAEEVGEVGRILNHQFGDKPKKATEGPDDLEGEIGDVLYTLACLANNQKIDLDKAMERAIHKMEVRDRDRFKKKSDD